MFKVHLCSPNSRAGARGIGEVVYIYTGDTDQWEPNSSLSTVTKPQPISASFKVPLVLNHSNPRKEEGGKE